MNPIDDAPGVLVANVEEVMELEALEEERYSEIDEASNDELIETSLASHIRTVFQENKDARSSSGMEEKLLQSLRAYNGHYDPEDMARIQEQGGSTIYMNVTPTKCRAAMSWIRDILLPANENAWALEPSPIPDLPKEIEDKVSEEIDKMIQGAQEQQQEQQGGPRAGAGEEGAQPEAGGATPETPQSPPPPQQKRGGLPKAAKAAATIQESNQMRLDLKEAFMDEIYNLASAEVKRFERQIADQLEEGKWSKALSEFIEDFCVFQVAVLKGPVITKKPRIRWMAGKPEVYDDFVFANKRVSPLDIYPSASATDIEDGNLCEHIRLHRKELYNLIGVEGYNEENIRELLDRHDTGDLSQALSTYIEEEKAIEEYRGDSQRASHGIFHGIHYFGTASYDALVEWGFNADLLGDDEDAEFDVECIMIGDTVIKCEINDDPLLRRPYFKASFQNIPGSWWGRSLPELMRDIQRMCNATARALANNMGIASGPQIEVYTDRIAADEELEDIYPLKLWQVTSDPTGAGGRAVQFWQPASNAGELLSVYEKFEVMADDATGIPRYAYGNERTGGAAQTASGLSMLLESASKGIKDAIRHIDEGLIKPRIEYQFYWNIISDPGLDFSGDVVVIPKGSSALTMKGAQEMRRNEFLQILANPSYLEIVGLEGIADILREMAKSLGLGANIVPSRIALKRKQEEAKAAQEQAQAQQQQMAQEQNAVGVQQVQMQTQQAEQASQRSAQLKQVELELKQMKDESDKQMKALELQLKRELAASAANVELMKQQMKDAQKDRDTNKNVALSVQSGYQDKNNQTT